MAESPFALSYLMSIEMELLPKIVAGRPLHGLFLQVGTHDLSRQSLMAAVVVVM